MTTNILELENVKNLDALLDILVGKGYRIEPGPHAVMEDHSEISVFKGFKNNELAFIIIAHYITQYYRVVLNCKYEDDQKFLEELLRVKYSGEKWSIPVNPVFIAVFNEDVIKDIEGYQDTYPVSDGEALVSRYREKNPGYKDIPRVIIARLIDEA